MASMTTYGVDGQIGILATTVRGWLRLEGVAAFVAGLALYGWLGGPWLAVLPFLLVPDLSASAICAAHAWVRSPTTLSTTGRSGSRCSASAWGPTSSPSRSPEPS